MGKVISKKIKGMSVWLKAGLVASFTLLVSVFMYQGFYKPLLSQAASTDLLHNSVTTGKNPWTNNANGWGVTNGKYGLFNCATCHTSSTTTNIKRVKTAVTLTNMSTFTAAGVANGVTSTVNVVFRNVTSMGHDPDPTAYNASVRVCQACHSRTTKHNSNNARPSVTDHAHNNRTDCTGCHAHNTGFKGAGECLSCHADVTGTAPNQRANVVAQLNSGKSHHIQSPIGGLTNAHCYQCHLEADSTGSMTAYHGGSGSPGAAVNLVIYGANGVRPTTYTKGTTYISYTAAINKAPYTTANARATLTNMNKHCLGCHNVSNKTFAAGTLNVTARNYFNDGKNPAQYAWDNLSTSIDQRWTNANTVAWSQLAGATVTTITNQTKVNIYGGNKKNTLNKALSAHGRADLNQRGFFMNYSSTEKGFGLASYQDEPWQNNSGTTNIACYDCHNSHGSNVEGAVTSYTSATTNGGILKDTISGQGGYNYTYRPYSGGNAAAPSKNKHTAGAGLCFDCHNTISAGTTSKVVGATTYSTPWGYNSTYGSASRIQGYYDTPDFGNYSTGSTTVKEFSGAQRRYPVKQLGNSSLNKGGHFGVSSAGVLATTDTIGGVCTKCHDPHGVTSDTTHVTATMYGVPLLKGNWMTSPYREDAPPMATTLTRGGGSGAALVTHASIPRYRIDQNTFGATATNFTAGSPLVNTVSGVAGSSPSWTFASVNTMTQTANTFGGLCLSSASGAGATGCHVQANIQQATNAAASSTTWKTMKRVHNSVDGWASTVAGGGNVNNAVHQYTCSKCHTPHSSNLPRLLVTNCLDWKHRDMTAAGGTVASTSGTISATFTANYNRGPTQCGMGTGRFPGGGARYLAVATGNTRASNSGPWFFGTKRTAVGGTATTGYTYSARACHDSATAGGAFPTTAVPTSQLWNTKSTW